MANQQNKIKELVNDDEDATAELEALTVRKGDVEADAHTFGLAGLDEDFDGVSIEKLRFDLEQLRSKKQGLEAEIKAREEMTTTLTVDLQNAERKLADEQRLLEEKDRTINALKMEVREREQASGDNTAMRELKAQQQRTEAHADELARRAAENDQALSDAKLDIAELKRAHEQEIRTLRFELGEAEETLAQNEDISEQLASDLVETRGYRDQLERVLSETEQQSTGRIEELEKQVGKLQDTVIEYEEKLEGKTEAINCLLAEFAKKTQDTDTFGDMEDVINEIDDTPPAHRVTRLLIGRVGSQELRFPLFKNRLTIGRTGANDIQLKAHHISRRHAIVVTEGDATRVVDWGSKNGVYVNSNRVTEHFLTNGDIVTIGTAEFRYEERRKRDS